MSYSQAYTGEQLEHAQTITRLLFDSDYVGLSARSIIAAFKDDARLVTVSEDELLETPVARLASKYKLAASSSAAKTLVQGRGLYWNGKTVPNIQFKFSASDLIDDRIAILRAGKDKHLVLAKA
jgi:tyrosyl-tRNA synthetase